MIKTGLIYLVQYGTGISRYQNMRGFSRTVHNIYSLVSVGRNRTGFTMPSVIGIWRTGCIRRTSFSSGDRFNRKKFPLVFIRNCATASITKGQEVKENKIPTKAKTGILMLNMGGPSSLNEVQDFLERLFTDSDIITMPMQHKLGPLIAKRRAPKIMERYRQIGGGSPIRKWTDKQGLLLTRCLDKLCPETAPHKHYIGFRYAHPLTEDTLDQIEREGIERVVAFSQYPQYSCSTSGSSFHAIYRYYANRGMLSNAKWSFIDRWPTHPGLVEAFSQMICSELEKFPPVSKSNVVLLFTAHSLPMKAVNKGDPYSVEVASTVLRVMERLEWKYPYRLVWQSKVGPLPWLGPHTDVALRGFVANGYKNFLLIPITFVNEHIETLHELDIEYGQELAEEIGIEYIRRVPTPNDNPIFIQALAEIVKNHLSSGDICSQQLKLKCPMCKKTVCHKMREWLNSLN